MKSVDEELTLIAILCATTMIRCLHISTAAFLSVSLCVAYRIVGSVDEAKPFVPYEAGYVGDATDPSTAERNRVNQGYAASVLLGDGVGKNRLFVSDSAC